MILVAGAREAQNPPHPQTVPVDAGREPVQTRARPLPNDAVSFAGSDDVIRTVTGFIGEPGVPGESNRAWAVAGQAIGEEQ